MPFIGGRNVMGKELVQESSLNALLEAFYNLDKRGRDGIIAAFREAADPHYPVLESGLKNNENDRVRNVAMEIYVALGEGSLPFHISLLNGADEEVRTSAASCSARCRTATPCLTH
jgi:hypothetical protein